MNESAESGFIRPRAVGEPMLLECDSQGRVLWMSGRTGEHLNHPANLIDVLRRAAKSGVAAAGTIRFWLLWEFRNSLVIGAQIVEQDEGTRALVAVEKRLSIHFLKLLEFEQRLAISAQLRRGSGARRAVRQIELERQRLGRELHTGVGQLLAAIRLQLEVIAVELPEPSEEVGRALDNISTLASDTLEQVRAISRRLHPPEWQRLTLDSAIRQLWEVSGVPQSFDADLRIDVDLAEPDLDVKILMYRGLQEALSNMARHSKASRISVELGLRQGILVLAVEDNGVGFDSERLFAAPASVAAGIGLRALRETAQELGGKLEVESGPNGTKLVVSVSPFPIIA
ncbi:MAG: sensor histidine kinase [Candidatus Solibacter sp.]